MAHALLAGCPLPVLRPTGPITAFMVDLYALANSLGIAYFSLLGCVCARVAGDVAALRGTAVLCCRLCDALPTLCVI